MVTLFAISVFLFWNLPMLDLEVLNKARTVTKVMQCPRCKRKNTLNFMPWLGLFYRCRVCNYQGTLALKETTQKSKI